MNRKQCQDSEDSYRLLAAGLLVIAFIFALAVTGNHHGPDGTPSHDDDKCGAWVAAQTFVGNQLRCPSTADFGWQTYSEAVTSLGGNRYAVSGYVDSQNGFGAMVRTQFACEVRKSGDKWTCEAMDIR